jgi:tRNA wybutosine-synthesizing protein 3
MKTKFQKEKEDCLFKLNNLDKSKKGNVDKPLIFLIEKINLSENYYTTSSCSGRISIFTIDENNKKNTANWIYVSHYEITYEEIKKYLDNLPKTLVRFKFEPIILHICCENLDYAQILLEKCQEIGLKDSGILSLKNKIILKIVGSERIDAPIAIEGELIVDYNYIKEIINLANKKLQKTHKIIEIIQKSILK